MYLCHHNHQTPIDMKYRYLTLLLMVAIGLGLNAQSPNFNGRLDDSGCRVLADTAASHIAAHCQARTAPTRVLPIAQYLTDDLHTWSDGLYLFDMYFDEDGEMSLSGLTVGSDLEHFDFIGPLYVKKGKIMVEDKPQARVNVERIGDCVMLVERDRQGKPVRAFYRVPERYRQNDYWILLINYLFMGHYTTPDSADVIFGPRMPFYTGYPYNIDPGIFGFYYDFDKRNLLINYGGRRVSHGDPSRPGYGRLEGGGGAGALKDPMTWMIVPTVAGLDVTIAHDEPFVDHFPRIGKEGDTVSLTHVESPFEGIPGKWAVASVIPLTHRLLQLFPKEVLTLMRGEIYARHGDTFKDPATQRYFDAQPWYKPTGGPIQLTDVERFNYQLIKSVELGVSY